MLRRFRPAIVAACVVAPVAAQANQIILQNRLSECVTAQLGKISTDANVVSTSALIQVHKPIAACGCPSALATYLSSVDRGGARQILQQGLIGLKSGGEKTIVLATEPALASDREIQLRLICAGPQ